MATLIIIFKKIGFLADLLFKDLLLLEQLASQFCFCSVLYFINNSALLEAAVAMSCSNNHAGQCS